VPEFSNITAVLCRKKHTPKHTPERQSHKAAMALHLKCHFGDSPVKSKASLLSSSRESDARCRRLPSSQARGPEVDDHPRGKLRSCGPTNLARQLALTDDVEVKLEDPLLHRFIHRGKVRREENLAIQNREQLSFVLEDLLGATEDLTQAIAGPPPWRGFDQRDKLPSESGVVLLENASLGGEVVKYGRCIRSTIGRVDIGGDWT
jgi:hypothetical protein